MGDDDATRYEVWKRYESEGRGEWKPLAEYSAGLDGIGYLVRIWDQVPGMDESTVNFAGPHHGRRGELIGWNVEGVVEGDQIRATRDAKARVRFDDGEFAVLAPALLQVFLVDFGTPINLPRVVEEGPVDDEDGPFRRWSLSSDDREMIDAFGVCAKALGPLGFDTQERIIRALAILFGTENG